MAGRIFYRTPQLSLLLVTAAVVAVQMSVVVDGGGGDHSDVQQQQRRVRHSTTPSDVFKNHHVRNDSISTHHQLQQQRQQHEQREWIFEVAVILPDMAKPHRTNWAFSLQRVMPAIEIALRRVVPPNDGDDGGGDRDDRATKTVKFRLHAADSQCSIAAAINEAFELYQRRMADVIFGPCCDYAAAPVARQVRSL